MAPSLVAEDFEEMPFSLSGRALDSDQDPTGHPG